MYICLDCSNLFNNAVKFIEKHGFDSPPYEEYHACPECGGAYCEAYTCSVCEDYILGDYIKTEMGDRICNNCYMEYRFGEEKFE